MRSLPSSPSARSRFAVAQTTLIPTLTELRASSAPTPSGVAWVLTGYLLAAAVSTPVTGRLGDMFGKRRLFVVSLSVFAPATAWPRSATRSRWSSPAACCRASAAASSRSASHHPGRVPRRAGARVDRPHLRHLRHRRRPRPGRSAASSPTRSPTTGSSGWARSSPSLAALAAQLFVPESPVRTPGRVDVRGAAAPRRRPRPAAVRDLAGERVGLGQRPHARPDRRRRRGARRVRRRGAPDGRAARRRPRALGAARADDEPHDAARRLRHVRLVHPASRSSPRRRRRAATASASTPPAPGCCCSPARS